jgi:hypothetical protein
LKSQNIKLKDENLRLKNMMNIRYTKHQKNIILILKMISFELQKKLSVISLLGLKICLNCFFF